MSKLRSAIAADDFNLGLLYPLEVTENLVFNHLPAWGWGANEDKFAHRMSRNDYIDAHYLSLNPPRSAVRVAIVVDIDSDLNVDLMKSLGIPMPKTITGRHSCEDYRPIREENPFTTQRCRLDTHDDKSARPHLIYWLDGPVFMRNKGQAQKYDRLCKRLKECLGTICTVDAINPTTTKNPAKLEWWSGDPAWHVIRGDDRLWTMDELDDAIRRAKVTYIRKPEKPVYSDTGKEPTRFQRQFSRGFRPEIAAEGRKQALYENMRFVAYDYKASACSEEDLFNYMLEQCQKFDAINNKQDPLPFSAIKSTAKSTSRWTWRYYNAAHDDKDRGACSREGLIRAGMPKRQRQAVGGQYGAKKNADAKRDTVFKAIEELQATGEPVVVSRLARDLGISRPTVRKYVNIAAEEATQKVVATAAVEAVPGVAKTVSIRERTNKDQEAPAAPRVTEKSNSTKREIILWSELGRKDVRASELGDQKPTSHLNRRPQDVYKPPDDIEVPAFLS